MRSQKSGPESVGCGPQAKVDQNHISFARMTNIAHDSVRRDDSSNGKARATQALGRTGLVVGGHLGSVLVVGLQAVNHGTKPFQLLDRCSIAMTFPSIQPLAQFLSIICGYPVIHLFGL